MAGRLADREPVTSPGSLIAGLVPPPLFGAVSFDDYHPDPEQPTQRAAVSALTTFAAAVTAPPQRGRWRRPSRRRAGLASRGVYLDGGFGVGKTHLLAALWHAVPGPKAYATFVELTHLAGALGFAALVDALSGQRLLAVDEFELDDPGDTVLISTLLTRLAERGVALAATSNTLPAALGEGRFATEDFRREIQGLADRFDSIRIDGADYRHRGLPTSTPAPASDEVRRRLADDDTATVDDFGSVLDRLSTLHPSRFGALVDGVSRVGLLDVSPVRDEAVALRLVVLADRLYDRQIPVMGSGRPIGEIFPAALLDGGYRKKYLRATSRLAALVRAGQQEPVRAAGDAS